MIIEAGADDRYLEAHVASVLARREREGELQAINSNEEFRVDGLSVGTGSSSSAQTSSSRSGPRARHVSMPYGTGSPQLSLPWFKAPS